MQDLHVLFGALFNLKILIVENCPYLSSLFSPNFIRCLNNLKEVTVRECGQLEEVFDLIDHGDDKHVEMLSKLEEMRLIGLPKLRHICNNIPPQVLCFQNLKLLRVEKCDNVMYLFPPSMVLALVQLQDLYIEACKIMEGIFAMEGTFAMEGRGSDNGPLVSCFQNLKFLRVKQCHSWMYLFSYSVALGQLQELRIEHCSKMKIIIKEDRPTQGSSLQNLKLVRVKQCDSLMHLFSASMDLVQLQELYVEDCPVMEDIDTAENRDFDNQSRQVWSFQYLKSVKVKRCGMLTYIFRFSMALGLVQLQDLSIEHCVNMKEIIKEDRDTNNRPPKVSCFKNLKFVRVMQCDNLKYLFSSSFAVALVQLGDLCIEHCSMMKEIVTAEKGVTDNIIFPQLTRVSLLNIPKLTSFYPSQNDEKTHMGDSNSAPGVFFNEKVSFLFFHIFFFFVRIKNKLLQKICLPYLELRTLIMTGFPIETFNYWVYND